jgi:hypothetical protein
VVESLIATRYGLGDCEPKRHVRVRDFLLCMSVQARPQTDSVPSVVGTGALPGDKAKRVLR